MKVDNQIIKIIKTLEEAGYSAYICGEAVWKHILGMIVEEYRMITSAPPFFLQEYTNMKHLKILFTMDKSSYLESCAFQADQLFYHPKYGILDAEHILGDIEKRILRINERKKEKIEEQDLLRGLVYHIKDSMQLDFKVEKLLLGTALSSLTEEMQKDIKSLLLADFPGHIFLKYSYLFSKYISISSLGGAILDFTTNDIRLRLTGLLLEAGEDKAIYFMEKLKFSNEIKDSVLHLLAFHNYPLSKRNIKSFLKKFKVKDIKLWFSINRAKALVKNQIQSIYDLDDLEKEIKHLIEIKEDMTENDLMLEKETLVELGYSLEEVAKIMKELLSLVKAKKVENSYEALLNKVLSFRQENP
ncbi:MAG: hypothetical protein K2N64_07425 [Anaeroplasmataceae bacterium]|nr:hypothetical protein [Anaeroplasmataceae bacterium]